MTTLGNRIREARHERLGLTQRELADKLGVEPVTISRWERGEVEPRRRHLREFAELTGLSVGWFYDETPEAVA